MEDSVIVKTFRAVFQEVLHGSRRFVIESFNYDIAMVRLESDHYFLPVKVVVSVAAAPARRRGIFVDASYITISNNASVTGRQLATERCTSQKNTAQ
jgi:hypothetical protein